MTVVLLLLALTAVVAPLVVRSGRFAPPLLAAAPLYGAVWVVRRIVDGTAATGITERYRWVPALDIDLALRLDGLAAFFALLILGIGTLVVLYAGRYLHDHGSLGRFYLLLLAFMASMLGLVLADGALPMFVFWEATSLTSYLLIGFDHDEESSRVAARKALIVTGSGGLALLGGLILLHEITGSWSIAEWTSCP
jgi:multicomponent Na+:H+ antiporter subunit A